MRYHLATLLVGTSLLFTAAGCEVKTGDHWDHPVVLASDLTPSALDGQWAGSWQSYEYWDNGLIHFVITPTDIAPTPATLPAVASPPATGTRRFLAHVKLWHWGTLSTEDFNMVLIATAGNNGQIQFHGDRDLGPMESFCKFDGFVDANKTVMSYVNKNDFGSLVLRRVVNVTGDVKN